MWVAAAFARREALRLRSLLPADVPMLLPGPGAPVLDAARAALRTLAKEEET